MAHHRLRDLVADAVDRVEGEAGVLEDHRDGLAAIGGELARAHRQYVAPVDAQIAADPRGRGVEPHQRPQRHAFAGAGFAEQSQRLAGPERQVDPAHGTDRLLRRGEIDGEPGDLDDARARDHAASLGCPDSGSARWQAALWSAPSEPSLGSAWLHRVETMRQRGWKRQPLGGSIGFGGSPLSGASCVRASGSMDGIEESSAAV